VQDSLKIKEVQKENGLFKNNSLTEIYTNMFLLLCCVPYKMSPKPELQIICPLECVLWAIEYGDTIVK
jgi:hypothetical protein